MRRVPQVPIAEMITLHAPIIGWLRVVMPYEYKNKKIARHPWAFNVKYLKRRKLLTFRLERDLMKESRWKECVARGNGTWNNILFFFCVIVIWKRMQKLYVDLFFFYFSFNYISFLFGVPVGGSRSCWLLAPTRSWLLHSNVFDRRQRLKVCACFIMIAIVVVVLVVFRRVGTTTNNDFLMATLPWGSRTSGNWPSKAETCSQLLSSRERGKRQMRLTYPGEKVLLLSSAREWTSRCCIIIIIST